MSANVSFSLQNIKFETQKSPCLGTGAYGSVYKAQCGSLTCAAKILHPTLFDHDALQRVAPKRAHRLPIRMFESECEFMSAIRHPNIVQYLGTSHDSLTDLPVLLMELMDESLTHFLEDFESTLPFHTQVNICHDIALALSFLHSNGIIHRDLSSNNVLMIGGHRAKVTDFGMARVFKQGDKSLTKTPGAEVYMPPEAELDPPVYGMNIDCFSYGVLIVQILSLVFPKPTSKYIKVSGSSKLHEKVSEIQRRQNHIELIAPDHPLLSIALRCLRDEEKERPASDVLCSEVTALQLSPQYTESKRMCDPRRQIRELKEEARTQRRKYEDEICNLKASHAEQIKDITEQKNCEICKLQETHAEHVKVLEENHQERIKRLKEHMKELEEDMKFMEHNHNHDIMELKEQHTLHLKSVEEEKEELRQKYKCAIYDFKENDAKLKRLEKRIKGVDENPSDGNSEQAIGVCSKTPNLVINWREKENPVPYKMLRKDSQSIFCNETLYVRPGTKKHVYAYKPMLDMWRDMGSCCYNNSTLAHINNTVLALGGKSGDMEYFNTIYLLTEVEGECMWKLADFSMPSKRCSVITVTTKTSLIVAGGEGAGGSLLRKVEVMDIVNRNWSVAANLPESLICSSSTILGDNVYLLGGQMGYNGVEKNLMFTCSITDLLKSSTKGPHKRKFAEPPLNIWKIIRGPLTTRSACVTFQGQVLAIGGRGEDNKATSAVYSYNRDNSSWSVVSYMTTTRANCFAMTVLQEGVEGILVVGGVTFNGRTCGIEIGTLEGPFILI